jgi:hypothetical protein
MVTQKLYVTTIFFSSFERKLENPMLLRSCVGNFKAFGWPINAVAPPSPAAFHVLK